jgi:fumarylacetoacetase
VKPHDSAVPLFQPTQELDFELEVGCFIDKASSLGLPIPIEETEEHLFGLVLVNDWSARDIQRWEYQPLGPFLAKSFATSISPWVVTLDALEPWRTTGPRQEPLPLSYLLQSEPRTYDIHLEVAIQTRKTSKPFPVCHTNFKTMYWSMNQQLAHLTSNGTNIQVGDLYASGTVSGETPGSFGSMLEICWRGQKPLKVEETGEVRCYLEDHDTVIMTGWCQGDGYRVGFGELRNQVLPALKEPFRRYEE